MPQIEPQQVALKGEQGSYFQLWLQKLDWNGGKVSYYGA